MAPLVRLDLDSPVAVITLCRPECANAISEALLDELGHVGHAVVSRAELRAVVITALGDKAFCGGADLKERQSFTESDVRRVLQKYRASLAWLERCPVPVVAALNGSALGGGLELALMCDLRVSAAHAQFGFPETSLGIIPGAGGTQRLPRLIGSARATELVLLGTRISAAEALNFGLVNRVTRPGVSVLSDTLQWLHPVVHGSPVAIRAALHALRAARESSLADGLAHELEAYEQCLVSEDRREALLAFAEKRPARFSGR
jgi:methylglutaconyl-CoA hydratase